MSVKDLTSHLQSLANSINKELGYSAVGYLGDYVSNVDLRISTGCSSLDTVLNGGLPVGRTIEIVGWESSGKSTIGYSSIIGAQEAGGLGIVIDSENSFHKDRFEAMGGDLSSIVVTAPITMEDAITSMIKVINDIKPLRDKGLIDEDAPVLIFWDTLHASTTSKIVESEDKSGDKNLNMYAGGMGERARLIQNFFRFASLYLPHNKAALLVANQLIDNIGGYGASSSSSGGNALKFYPSIRMRCKKIGPFNDGDDQVGISTEVEVFKNKVDAPVGKTLVPIRYATGIDDHQACFISLVESNFIVRKGSWYKFAYGDQEFSFYEKNFSKLFDDIPHFDQVLSAMVSKPDLWQKRDDGTCMFPLPSNIEDSEES